ncbi:MAG: TRAP transporter substrate-binding protein [Clostridiales bacterium]|nr:TRAP transporter substrate-binding protein [Clostridiales bacterium]
MKSKRRIAIIAMVLVLAMVLGACGSGNQQGTEPPVESNESEDYEETTIIFAHSAPVTDARHVGVEAFKEYVEKTSGGKVKVDIFPGGQLGDTRSIVEATQTGGIHISLMPPSNIAGFNPLLAIADVPYLLPGNLEQAREVIAGPAGQALLDTMEDYGMVGLVFLPDLYKAFTANKPILSPADLKGLKLRVMQSPILIKMMEAWGASGLTIDYGETFTALQTGAIDAQEAGVGAGIYNMKFYEVQDYMMLSNHILGMQMIFANKEWFDGLNPATQKLIKDGSMAAHDAHKEARLKTEENALKAIEEHGTKIIELTEEQMKSLSDAAKQPCLDYFVETNGAKGQALVDIFDEELNKLK